MLEREAGEAQCPLCGQALSDEHRDQLLDEFPGRGQGAGRCPPGQHGPPQRDRRREPSAWNAEIRRLDRELEGQPAQQRREAQLEQALADAQAGGRRAGAGSRRAGRAGAAPAGRRLCP